MSRRNLKSRLAMRRRNQVLLNNRLRTPNPLSRSSRQNHSRKIRRTPADGRDRATPVPEALVPDTLPQNHLEAATPLRDRRQQRQMLQRQDPRREPPRQLNLPVGKNPRISIYRAHRKKIV